MLVEDIDSRHTRFAATRSWRFPCLTASSRQGSTKLSATTKLDTMPDCVIQAGKHNPDSYRDHLTTEPPIFCRCCYRFGVLLRPLVCRSFWSCGWTDTLFAKLGFERWLVRLGNVCGCEGLAVFLFCPF